MTPATLREAAALIESLESERDALAEQVRVMREALEWSNVHVEYVADLDAHSDNPTGEATVALRLMEVALALTPTAAEEQAKANAEKAAEYDKMTLQVLVANADRDRLMAKADANEEAAQAFDRLAEACGVETSEGGHGFPIADVLQAALENLAHRRGEAKANAEKAALLDSIQAHGWTIEHRDRLSGHLRWLVRKASEHIGLGLTLADALRAAREASDGN